MPAPSILKKSYFNFFGVDKKSSDLTRKPEFASDMLNAQYRPSGAIEKRTGYQYRAQSAGGYGRYVYKRFNPDTGAETVERLVIDQNLHREKTTTLTVSYSGSAAVCDLSLIFDDATSQYRLQIQTDTTVALDYALGLGFDEASPVTIATLSTAINAVADFTASVTGTNTVSAAFLNVTVGHDLKAGSASLTATYYEQVNSTVTNPLSAYYALRNASNFELASSVVISNTFYLGGLGVYPMKYDGQTFYRAGLPSPTAPTSVLGAGGVTGTNYVHVIQYLQYDNAGQIVASNVSSGSAPLTATADSFDVTIPNILAGSGFNTNGAIVDGAQLGVTTITVDSGHTLKVGDTAYFFNELTNEYVARPVTAVAATTITISGVAVDVADNAVISNNLRIALYRNETAATTPDTFYLVAEMPNNSFAATQVYNDDVTDANLGALLISPATDRSPPPKGRYVSQWNGIMTVCGLTEDPNYFSWSSYEGPEYFPVDENFEYIETNDSDIITGCAPNNETFYIFKNNAFAVISGDIISNQIRIEIKARNVGCIAHNTIVEVDGVLYWLSEKGPRYSSGGQLPQGLGTALDVQQTPATSSRIDPEFSNPNLTVDSAYKLKRSQAINDLNGKRYVLFVPAESTTGGNVWTNDEHRLYVYEYTRDAWLIWGNINCGGGFTYLDSDIEFSTKQYSTFATAVISLKGKMLMTNTKYDYADNSEAVSMSYTPQWDALGEPAVLKKCITLKLYSQEFIPQNTFEVTVEQEVNYIEQTKASFVMSLISGGYGFSAYGDDAYGDFEDGEVSHPLARDRIRAVRTKFVNENIHENIVISGWEMEFVTPFEASIKS